MAATNRSIISTTQIVHVGSGASMATLIMSASADISTALTSANCNNWDRADLAIKISNTASVSSASNFILVYRRDKNIDGANHEPVPSTATSTAWSNHLVGAIQIPPYSVASTTYVNLTDVPMTFDCEFYLENRLNTAVGLGWTIKVTPKTDSFV